jgi:hypothetical protein
MFGKLIIVAVLTAGAYFIPETRALAGWILFFGVVIAFVIEGVRIVPQQFAYVVERFGRFHEVLEPGLNLIIPFLDRIAYTHSLKEVPIDVPNAVAGTVVRRARSEWRRKGTTSRATARQRALSACQRITFCAHPTMVGITSGGGGGSTSRRP